MNAVRHHKSDKKWEVDVGAVAKFLNGGSSWVAERPKLLEDDLKEMEQWFSHWFLVGGLGGGNFAKCLDDGEFIVPTQDRFRCLNCAREYRREINYLGWIGLLPVSIAGADRVMRMVSEQTELRVYNNFLLAPISIFYPEDWPHSEPDAFYDRSFFRAIGNDHLESGHSTHMLSNTKMCLFHDWNEMSIRNVLAERVAPHALAHIKIANGERPKRWFN